VARAAGRPVAFCAALLVVVAWAASGQLFGFSDTWQLVINTGTTIVTFLMVFLIQHTQYRDAEAVQVKLGELIRAVDGAHNAMVDLDALSDDELDQLHERYAALAARARSLAQRGRADTGGAELVQEPARHLTTTGVADSSASATRRRSIH
jgi:low affinity Fe/Cu permease